MSTTKHTPTPWHSDNHTGSKPVVLWDEGGRYIAHVESVGDAAKTMSNARRIVQCVNACEGIEDPAAALVLVREAISKILRHIPVDAGGCSISADVDLCKQALRVLGVQPPRNT